MKRAKKIFGKKENLKYWRIFFHILMKKIFIWGRQI